MDDNHPIPGWNAHRHPSSPIAQPRYRFQDVPKCQKDLNGSVIQEVTTREAFKEIMAEMVLLCTEAMKRSRSGRTASKPLSLEYIADRLDVDDPCFGYVVRTDSGHLQGFVTVTTFTNWQRQFKWDSLHEVAFYYDDDSDNSADGEEDGQDGENHQATTGAEAGVVPPPRTPSNNVSDIFASTTSKKRRKGRKRVLDEDGSLAMELQGTVRLGDPYNEGIVWPRIAEISLLGALGCGKALVQLVIEQLEFQRGSAMANYDYIALQATDNSIPFYESRGFVRVGAVTYDTKDPSRGGGDGNSRSTSPTFSESGSSRSSAYTESTRAVEAVPLEPSSPEKPEAIAMPQQIVSSPHFVYEVEKPGETPNDIARRFKMSVWDIVFLNKDIFKDLRPTSRLIKGTLLHVPEAPKVDDVLEHCQTRGTPNVSKTPSTPGSPTKWFVAKENDTPRKIATMYGISCNKLVLANRRRLPELQATSRLKAGTRVKVSNLDHQDEICQPYCHWSFPEDTAVEGGEPSYMMVYKLDRKTARCPRTVRDSFAVPVTTHSPPKLLFPAPPKTTEKKPLDGDFAALRQTVLNSSQVTSRGRSSTVAPSKNEPKMPRSPLQPSELRIPPPEDGRVVYWAHQKELHPELMKSTPESERIIRDRWSRLAGFKKEKYHVVAAEARKQHALVEHEYIAKVKEWKRVCRAKRKEHEASLQQKQAAAAVDKDECTLFNMVVRLREDALDGKEYKYWFVLTYIPDLKWCHLAPMIQEGHFGPDRKRSYGRPRYRLVDEKLGKELDISSMYCLPVKSKALKRTADADKEEWDIIDGPVELVKLAGNVDMTDSFAFTETSSSSSLNQKKTLCKVPKFRARSAIKPLNGKIAVGTAIVNHSQDPLKRTRSSPQPPSRKRIHEEIQIEDDEPTTSSPMRERNRRRCMRCVENGASWMQAVECLGAKGRFGRSACEYFNVKGVSTKASLPVDGTPSGRKPRHCSRCVDFGASDEQATNCPGAKGRLGRTACAYFSASGEKQDPEEFSEDQTDDDDVDQGDKKSLGLATRVKVEENDQVEVFLSPTRPCRRPDVSPAPLPTVPRWTSAAPVKNVNRKLSAEIEDARSEQPPRKSRRLNDSTAQ